MLKSVFLNSFTTKAAYSCMHFSILLLRQTILLVRRKAQEVKGLNETTQQKSLFFNPFATKAAKSGHFTLRGLER